MKTTFVKASLLALALGTSAAASAAEFNYNYVEGGFGELDSDGDALFLRGAHDIDKNWGLVGGLYVGDADPNIDVTAFEVGAQYHQPLKSNLGFHAGLQLLHVEVDVDTPFGSASDDDTGLIANAGLRFQVQPQFQLEGDVTLSSNDMLDDGLGLRGAARYYFTNELSAAGGLAVDTELDGLFVSLRYDM
jgi:opacity protein-like surface antigen